MAAALLLLRLALLLVVAHAEPQLQLPAHPGLGVRGAALLLSQRGVQLPPPTSLDSGNGSSWVSPPEGEHAVSALRLLEDWRDATTGLFEFLIVWPGIHINGMVAHNRWFQRSNPLTTHHVSDYSAHVVLAPYSTAYTQPAPFAGLFRGKRDCLLFGGDDGSFCVAYSGPGTKSGEGGRRTLAWPGFQVTPVVTPLERHDRVTWTELWVVNARGAAVRPAPPPLPPAPPPLPDDMGAAVYEGFDVILVIGQSNSVGYG